MPAPVLLALLGCRPGAPVTTPCFGSVFAADLDGDGLTEPVHVEYEQVRIGTLVTPVPKVQIHEPTISVVDIDLNEPQKELVIQAVDVRGIGVWHVLIYLQGKVSVYTFEVSAPPELLGDGVLRTRFSNCGETTVTDWARSGAEMTQTRSETMGIYNVALCSG